MAGGADQHAPTRLSGGRSELARAGEEEVKGSGLWSGTSVWWMEEGRLSTSLSVMYGDN